MGIAIDIRDSVSPALKRLGQGINSTDLTQRIAARTGFLTRQHLASRNAQGNAQGFPRTNFFAAAARSVNFRATSTEAVVAVSKVGFAQRYFGGEIRPVNSKALTIPVHPAAYAHRAREFDLHFVPQTAGGRTVGLLVHKSTGREFGEIFYVLVSRVNQKADPSVLPTQARYEQTVTETVTRFVSRTMSDSSGGAA